MTENVACVRFTLNLFMYKIVGAGESYENTMCAFRRLVETFRSLLRDLDSHISILSVLNDYKIKR